MGRTSSHAAGVPLRAGRRAGGRADGLPTKSEVRALARRMAERECAVYVLEYSPAQGCFHIETIQEMTRDNLLALLADRMTDFVPVAVGVTYAVAEALAGALEEREQQIVAMPRGKGAL